MPSGALHLGRPYRLKVVPDNAVVIPGITARGSSLVASVPELGLLVRRAAIRSALRHWYRDHAKMHFSDRVSHTADLLGIERLPVRVVDQSKRWGSCDARGTIRLNWRCARGDCHILETTIHDGSGAVWRLLCRTMTHGFVGSTSWDICSLFCKAGLPRGVPIGSNPAH
nr:YgjP-like metallopeptidase domain-containing protein [Bradyrhizobium sp. CCBAU 53415]